MFGSVFKQKYSLKNEVALLYEELRTIESIKTMVKHQGWVDLAGWIIGRISDLRNEIIEMSANVDENKKSIEYKNWSITLYESLINVVGTTLDREKDLQDKLKNLEEIARIAELEK